MKRLPNWQELLIDEVNRTRGVEFSRAGNDCCRFVNRCIMAMTQVDVGRQFLDQYKCTREAIILLKLNSLGWYATQALGATVALVDALLGDVVLIPSVPLGIERLSKSIFDSIGILMGAGAYVVSDEHGLMMIPKDHLSSKAWKVGH